MPVQEPVLTAQTKVFSSPGAVAVFSEAVAVFSTLVAIFDELNVSPIHALAQAAQLSDWLQAGEADSCSWGSSAARDTSPAPDGSNALPQSSQLKLERSRITAALTPAKWRRPNNKRAKASARAA